MRKKYFPPFVRNCPECGVELVYTNVKNRNRAEKLGKICRSCRGKEISSRPEIVAYRKMPVKKKALPPFIRNCPICNREIEHTTVKYRNRAEKIRKMCRSCRSKEISSRPGVTEHRIKNRRSYAGESNPFFGKKHSEDTKAKIRDIDRGYTQTAEFRRNSARPGSQNGMYGKSFYDVWEEKYGREEADKRFSRWLTVQSKNSSGKNNPMYGRPSPRGSGGGWGGWYKSWYFRSLRELSYMISVIEKKGYIWESAERNNLAIPYVGFDGASRTYRADFLLDKKILIEVKPKQLMKTPSNLVKKAAALVFCEERGLEFRMVDVRVLDKEFIIELFENGIIVFNKKYQQRMKTICRLAKNRK